MVVNDEQLATGFGTVERAQQGKPVMGCTHWRDCAKFHCGIKGLWAESPAKRMSIVAHFGRRRRRHAAAKAWDGARILASPTAESAHHEPKRASPQPSTQAVVPVGRRDARWPRPCRRAAVNLPVTAEQRNTANQVAQAGVPLSELSPNAPDSHTVERGDTLWDISKLFLRSPWRWPELWGMNLEQIKQPAPDLSRARCCAREGRRPRHAARGPASRRADTGNVVKLSPRVRAETLDNGAIPSIPLHLIGPFLNEAVVFSTNELAIAPRIVAVAGGPRAAVARRNRVCARRAQGQSRLPRVPRSRAAARPDTGEVLGYEARYVGTAEFVRDGGTASFARRQERADRAGDLQDDQHPPGSRCRRPPGAGAAARLRRLRAACAGAADQGPHRHDLRRSDLGRTEPDRHDQPRQQRRRRARPCDGAVARRQRMRPTPPTPPGR